MSVIENFPDTVDTDRRLGRRASTPRSEWIDAPVDVHRRFGRRTPAMDACGELTIPLAAPPLLRFRL